MLSTGSISNSFETENLRKWIKANKKTAFYATEFQQIFSHMNYGLQLLVTTRHNQAHRLLTYFTRRTLHLASYENV